MKLASESKVGVATTMFGIGTLATSIISGILSDKFGRRKPLLIIGATGYIICGVILFFGHKLWHILLYRFINGLASGLVYTTSMTCTADVYPSQGLSVQMSLLNISNSIGYMIGPEIGGILYDRMGVRGVSFVVIFLGGVLALALSFAIREPLAIRKEILETVRDDTQSDSTLQQQLHPPLISKKSTETTVTPISQELETIDLLAPHLQEAAIDSDDEDNRGAQQKNAMSLWKLILQWPVLSSSLTTLSMGMLTGALEHVLPIHAKGKFSMPPSKIGILFMLNGSVAIVLSAPVGWAISRLISRYGERMRTVIEVAGLWLTAGAMLLMGFSTTFDMIIGADAWMAATILIVNIPVMSSFGDFVNSLNLNSMARCYGIYNAFWALSSTIAPPIATTFLSGKHADLALLADIHGT
ncbi:hypothetical protein GGI12_003110 [Dipsacomyces acuminosporus]|nr:hypothetical protein GGI12_003110 [Dipsacomyces acuminosporus]